MARIGNTLRTGIEANANIIKAGLTAGLLGVAGGLLANYLGVHIGPEHVGPVIGNVIRPNMAFLGGVGGGIFQNALLIGQTLKKLGPTPEKPSGSTSPGNYKPVDEDDNTVTYSIECVDARIKRKSAAYPGATTQFGAPLTGVTAAVVTKAMFPDNPATDALLGYHLSNNLLTAIGAHIGTAVEIIKISSAAKAHAPKKRVAIQMRSHWEGCGAQGFTNIPSYFAKFSLHNPAHVADIIGIPNEILGFVYVNGILSPLTAILSGGRVNLTANITHSHVDTIYHGEDQPTVQDHGQYNPLE